MQYLLTKAEMENLKGFDRAREWEHALSKWYSGLLQEIFREMRSSFYEPMSFDNIKRNYELKNPYPKLEDYMEIESDESELEDNTATN